MPVGAAFGGTLVTGGTLFSIIMEQSGESSTPDPLSGCGGGCGWRESAAVDGTPVGGDVLFGMVDGFNNNLGLTVEGWEDGEAGGVFVGDGGFLVVGLRIVMGAAFGGTLVGGTLLAIVIE